MRKGGEREERGRREGGVREERGRREGGGREERGRSEGGEREGGSMYQMVCRTPMGEGEEGKMGGREDGEEREKEIRSRRGTK